jgi:hypothetical protein
VSVERHSAVAIARGVSIGAHPFVVALVLVGIATAKLHDLGSAARLVGLTSIILVVPLWLFMWRKWRSGQWETVDASTPSNRPALYALALLLMAALTATIGLLRGWDPILRGCTAVAGMLGAAAFLNRWIKLSMHVAFASFAAAVLLRLDWRFGAALVAIVPLLAWSRLALARHTWREVLGGACLGVTAGALLIAL